MGGAPVVLKIWEKLVRKERQGKTKNGQEQARVNENEKDFHERSQHGEPRDVDYAKFVNAKNVKFRSSQSQLTVEPLENSS